MFERVLRHLSAPALLVVVLALFTATPATASPDDVVKDCADDGYVETGRHSRSDLRRGRDRIPADLDEYSDCRAQINKALSRPRGSAARNRGGGPDSGGTGGGIGGGGGGGSADGGSAPDLDSDGDGALSDKERQAAADRKRRTARADTEALLGDRKVDPGAAGVFEKADASNGLSLPVLLALIALTLLLAAGALVAVRRRHPEFLAGTLGRLPKPRGRGLSSFRRRR